MYFTLIKKLLPKHLRDDSPGTSEVLTLRKSILRIGDIDRHFRESALLVSHLIDELRTVFHSVHSEANLFYRFESHHAVSVMCVRQPYSADKESKELPAEEDESPEKRDIAVGFDDEAGTENEIKRRIFLKSLDKSRYILDVMLSVRVESHDILDTHFLSVTANILKPGFECRTASSIERMMHDMEDRKLRQYLESVVFRSVVHHEDMNKTRM